MKKEEDEVDELETTIEEFVEVSLDEDDPERKVLVGALLKDEEKEELTSFLRINKDIFAWSHKDILGIYPSEAKHCLNIDPTFPLV